MTDQSRDPLLLTAKEVAELFRVPQSSVYYWAREQHIPAIKLGRHWRFSRSSLVAWIEKQELGSSTNP